MADKKRLFIDSFSKASSYFLNYTIYSGASVSGGGGGNHGGGGHGG
ncbi:hypothetical protein HCG69_15625 [Bacteroides sp. K03]|nr:MULTISPECIES: hypothetical protein [Bacteroides]MBX9189489.1 hypothetical protein [Bacteroides sp. K03]